MSRENAYISTVRRSGKDRRCGKKAERCAVVKKRIVNTPPLLEKTNVYQLNTADEVQRKNAWQKLAGLSLPVYIMLTMFISLSAPFLVRIFLSNTFKGAAIFVSLGALMELNRMVSSLFSYVSFSELKPKYLIPSGIAASIITIVGVVFSCKSEYYKYLIPLVLTLSSSVGTIFVVYNMRMLLPITIELKIILKSLLLSIPFTISIAFYRFSDNLVYSLGIVGVLGCYFAFVFFRSMHKTSTIIN